MTTAESTLAHSDAGGGTRAVAVTAALVATAAVATAFPLWTWSTSLALFGLPHVLMELRFVDERFGARAGARTAMIVGTLLLAVVGTRTLALSGALSPAVAAPVELGLVALLAASVVPRLARFGFARAALGAAIVACLGVLVVRAPIDALIALAFLHNLTPVAFLTERLRGAERRRALLLCTIAFGVVPLCIATGWPATWLGTAGLGDADASSFAIGTLAENRAVFVPSFVAGDAALDLFRCAAYLQCLHYAVVIHVLPRLGPGRLAGGWFAWPARRRFAAGVAAVGALTFLGFVWAFRDTRAIYGVFAAVHAWVEVPVLLLALTAVPWSPTRSRSA